MHAIVVQASPSLAQMPQLSLQQYSPGPQTFLPHCSPPLPPSLVQASSMQPSPGLAQMPQLSLQQYSPLAQVFAPQVTPVPASWDPMGTSPSELQPPPSAPTKSGAAQSKPKKKERWRSLEVIMFHPIQ